MLAVAAVLLIGTATGCGSGDSSTDGRANSGTSDPTCRPRAAVTVAQARRILGRYERVAARADRARDATLLAEVAAGNALERSKAAYQQYASLPERERASLARPAHYRDPKFHIPAGASWFLVTATRTRPTPQPTVLVFEAERGGQAQHTEHTAGPERTARPEHGARPEHRASAEPPQHTEHTKVTEPPPRAEGAEDAESAERAEQADKRAQGADRRKSVGHAAAWRLRAALPLQDGRLPHIATTPSGLATEADPTSRARTPRPYDIPTMYEDLWQTGGTEEAAALAPNAVTKEARSTYRHRDDELGAEGARRRFVPTRPRHRDSYALRTADGGVLAVVPLAHQQRLRVTRPGYQLTPSGEEAVYDPTPRSTVISTFHGQALAHLPRSGRPTVLSAKYALVDSR
ncbi:hypothetical protein [Streptomyces spirodelae]|uniref:DUF8094 domain-containing protein n=1 Tax=Streptomyces spirodelae TaxID=2812904 RepID=A0ABS3X3Z6_9ACTN|nr:hypothetical protein [Streptomyces spirodelae]MBO8190029.1 hypothetical protein [Streptomyces spirodelae]